MVHSRCFCFHLFMASQCILSLPSVQVRVNVHSFSMNMMASTNSRTRRRPGGGGVSSSISKANSRRRKSNQNNRRRKTSSSPTTTPKSSKPKPKPVKRTFTDEELCQMPIGQAIQEASTASQLLSIACALRLWLPTDDNLPSHLRTQRIHTEKRIKAASLLLQSLGDKIRNANVNMNGSGEEEEEDDDDSNAGVDVVNIYELWENSDETVNGLKRTILAASDSDSIIDEDGNVQITNDNANAHAHGGGNEHKNLHIALMGLHSIVGYTLPTIWTSKTSSSSISTSNSLKLDKDIANAIKSWIQKANSYAWAFSLKEAVEVRWAIRGILSRMDLDLDGEGNGNGNGTKGHHGDFDIYENMSRCIPNLNQRVSKLPFDIIPACVDWGSVAQSPIIDDVLDNQNLHGDTTNDDHIMNSLLAEIPFQFDTITTRDGSSVKERRSTAWVVANDNIGALAYSGKLMPPKALPPTSDISIVRRAMRQVEKGILLEQQQQLDNNKSSNDHLQDLQLCREEIGEYFDCALCNHYPDEESACKFHTDPEHGTYWERLTCVVSAGNDDIRKFAFRPIPNENSWFKYETKIAKIKAKAQNAKSGGSRGGGNDEIGIVPAVIPLFPGDVVKMHAECNDLFHHAVYGSSENRKKAGNGRISLVFKRAIDRGNGRKGHGRAGGGVRRRNRRL